MLNAREPATADQTGLELIFIADLALKIIYFQGMITAQALSEHLCLPYLNNLKRSFTYLKREDFIEVAGSTGFALLAYQCTLTPKGSSRAHEQVERNAYVEPAPVTLESYRDTVLEQAKSAGRISRNEVV
jgi:hypothetical protein